MTQQLELFGDVVGVATCVNEAHTVLREYAERVNVSREVIDGISGVTKGYSAKLLSNPPYKKFSIHSLFSIAGALGLAIGFLIDKQRKKQIESAKQRPYTPNSTKNWRNAKAACMAEQLIKKSAVIRGSEGGKKRWEGTSAKERSAYARKIARKRWKDYNNRRLELRQLLNRQ